jgi:hypothetical protein
VDVGGGHGAAVKKTGFAVNTGEEDFLFGAFAVFVKRAG